MEKVQPWFCYLNRKGEVMEFTDEELQFLQRLIGHHLTANSCPEGLYDKIVLHTQFRGIYSKKPLPLEAPENSFYRDRIFLRLKTKVWFEG